MGDRQWFVLYILVCFEVGIFLTLVPWSVIWDRNYFLQAYPGLGNLILEPFFRGAVSGLGVANIYLALNEVVGRRRASRAGAELFPGGLRFRNGHEDHEGRSSEIEAGSDAEAGVWTAHEKRS